MFIGHLIYLFASAVTIASAVVTVPASEMAVQDRAAHAATVNGKITIVFPNVEIFVATFAVNGTTYTFRGSSSSVPLIATADTNAVLTFNQASQLTGSQAFTGTQGPTQVNLNLDSGATLSWTLLPPSFSPLQFSGSGTWSSS